jgi:AcrR family transcriptional regulator
MASLMALSPEDPSEPGWGSSAHYDTLRNGMSPIADPEVAPPVVAAPVAVPGRPGRPRDPRLDQAILDATLELLAESGYGGLTIEAVAARAGTTKPAVYRRWPSKAHLVHEAVFPIDHEGSLIPATDDLARDLHDMIVGSLEVFGRPEARLALPGLLAEMLADASLHAKLLARFESGVWSSFRDRMAVAVARGEVRDDVDADAIIDAIAGAALMALTLHSAAPLDEPWVRALTDLILRGIVA